MLAGTTVGVYYDNRELNSFGYDSVDEVVITAATSLNRRYLTVFGLLYECHSIPETARRIPERGFAVLPEQTIRRYMRDAKSKVIESIAKDDKTISKIKEIIRIAK